MSYRQLTPEKRYQIGAYLRTGMTKSEIAREIRVDRSTITRELRRNASGRWKYNPSRAIKAARERHENKRKKQIDCETWMRVEALLNLQWSPEQISKRLKLEGRREVSHETIYLYIYRDKQEGGLLYLNLRRRHRYRKRIHKYCKRGFRDPRRPIAERPLIVEMRLRTGDWEADTIIGGRQNGAVLSLVERKSRFCLLQKVSNRSAETIAAAACRKLRSVKDKVLTITSDNGSEFAGHKKIALNLNADFFFADPYSAWQRGTNENTNGLVRQYIPKRSDFSLLADQSVQLVEYRLNTRPRKALGFKTPYEVFFNQPVALMT